MRLLFERVLCDRCGTHVDRPWKKGDALPLPHGWVVIRVKGGNDAGTIYCSPGCAIGALGEVP